MKLTGEAKMLLGIAVVTILLFAGGVYFLTNSGSSAANQGAVVSDTAALYGNGRHVKGNQQAKAKLVEFLDFQCPACRASYPLIKQLEAEYKDNLAITIRHFPLPQHTNAIPAAIAAEAAGEQGKFWEMAELLFNNQDSWSQGNPESKFIEYAQSLGLNIDQFTADMKSDKYDSIIQNDYADGVKIGVNSTPSIYLNETKYTGNFSVQGFKERIDSLLR